MESIDLFCYSLAKQRLTPSKVTGLPIETVVLGGGVTVVWAVSPCRVHHTVMMTGLLHSTHVNTKKAKFEQAILAQ